MTNTTNHERAFAKRMGAITRVRFCVKTLKNIHMDFFGIFLEFFWNFYIFLALWSFLVSEK